jgi:biopolymer transport protein ExbD
MKFHRSKSPEPEINLIPFIDILLVVVIFLMLSTTYSKLTEMQLNLPVADAEKLKDHSDDVVVGVDKAGGFSINKTPVNGRDVQSLSRALAQAAQGIEHPMVIISADAQASHQAVMLVMDAARRNGMNQLTFAAQSSSGAAE